MTNIQNLYISNGCYIGNGIYINDRDDCDAHIVCNSKPDAECTTFSANTNYTVYILKYVGCGNVADTDTCYLEYYNTGTGTWIQINSAYAGTYYTYTYWYFNVTPNGWAGTLRLRTASGSCNIQYQQVSTATPTATPTTTPTATPTTTPTATPTATPITTTYNCSNGTCVSVDGYGGTFTTYDACMSVCIPVGTVTPTGLPESYGLPYIGQTCYQNTCIDDWYIIGIGVIFLLLM